MLKDKKVLLFLVFIYALAGGISVFLPQAEFFSDFEYPAPDYVISLVTFLGVGLIYGTLGLLGLKLNDLTGFPKIMDKRINNKERFVLPIVTGLLIGVIMIMGDLFFDGINNYGKLPHPKFFMSFLASLSAGIGEEIVFRLLLISFIMWLFGIKIFKGRHNFKVFIAAVIFSSIAFAASHVPSFIFILEQQGKSFGFILGLELFVLNTLVSVFAAVYYKRYGIIAAMGIHFWADIMWHMIYGNILTGLF